MSKTFELEEDEEEVEGILHGGGGYAVSIMSVVYPCGAVSI